LASNQQHLYIPLLAVNPGKQRLGHGTSILKHLIAEAALALSDPTVTCHDVLFLDVYTSSVSARELYLKFGFQKVTDAIHDPAENKDFIVMGRRISIASNP
jgi:ribosomal protein S18 acetylase RimI-like enzyme